MIMRIAETGSLRHCWWKYGTDAWEKFGQFLLQQNMHILQNPAIAHLGYLSQRNENLCSCKNLHTNIHSSFIHNTPKLERNIFQPVNG